ncbi:tudor domain-containing protein 5 isoform X1 [Gymnogyps californianus]|uniref:tudor domain-containing protein 5 isoform X1 n=1 Tax=Gymnogyps californianus TaxID=33616 RepID=UPI0021C91091|nr:tudor domain-containing protein 5 isoform X1 [Gymnogyps californianus]
MSKQAKLMEVLKKEVRSLLVAAKEGLTPAQLEQEYMAMIGKPLPLRDLGFQSTLELVADMPEVVRVCPYEQGTFILKAIADETTKAIAKLVARQRRSARVRKSAAAKVDAASPSKNLQSFPQRGRAPVLPATVKAELQDLLSSSPLLLLDFDKAFFSRFGRAFQYTQYGFFSMFEVLKSVSDIIAVEQTKAGSLLTLKKYLASETEKEEMPQGEVQEEMPQDETQEEMVQEEMPQAAPAVEMPPLEPSCETESFHLIAEEKSEPVETQAVDLGDGLKQPQDLEQSLLDKLIMTPEIPPDAVQDRSLCSLPPLERRCLVGVFVEFIISPSQFYIHICSRETSDKLQDMMIEMRHCYSNKIVSDRYIMPESSVQPGQLCCVMVSKWWYRVIIHRVISDQEVEVFYPDYGNLEIVRKSCLRFLKWCYLKLPAQAIPCSLAWVKPVEGTWSNAATLLFKQLCGSKLLVGIVDEYVNGILHLFLCDTSTKEDVYFHCVLRDGGCADVCGENIPSQGFKELNPSALYVQPSGKQENAELVEPDLHLQQESLDPDSETATSQLDGDELCDQQRHLPATKETWDDVRPLLDEVSVLRTTDQDPELAQEDTNETPTELMAVVKTPHSLGESSMPAVLFKSVEDFCTSFIHSKQPAEMSQDDPDQIERFSNKAQLREAVHPSVLLMAIPFMPDNPNNEEKMKNKDLPRSLAVGLCSARGLSDQGPSQKLYVPPTTLSAVLAAARLATSSDYFQWLPSLRRKV